MTQKCSKDAPEFVKHTLAIIGDKWTALIVRMLHTGPQRFKDLEAALNGMSPRTLSQRLDMLTCEGIIEKTETTHSGFHSYALTQKGLDLDEVVHAMAKWGMKHHGNDTEAKEMVDVRL